ncbi:MAG: hypothetical protein IPM26_07015 [Saprospiraceae bacterium]|nr:hypothetical protein [Saprospiraceae bacterium]
MSVFVKYVFIILVLSGFSAVTYYQYKIADRMILLTEENHEHSEENSNTSNQLFKEINYISTIQTNLDISGFTTSIKCPDSIIIPAGKLFIPDLYSPPERL